MLFADAGRGSDQTRTNIFDLRLRKPDVLHERVVEVDHRVRFDTSGKIEVEREPDIVALRPHLEDALRDGITSVAICLVHSYLFPAHEHVVADLARQVGFAHVSVSSSLVPMIRFERRASTAVADAYLSPLIEGETCVLLA